MDSITIDLNGRRCVLTRERVAELRDLAANDAGSSSARRDLSLVLERALHDRRAIVLRRGEIRALAGLLASHSVGAEFDPLRAALALELN